VAASGDGLDIPGEAEDGAVSLEPGHSLDPEPE
jgi:hypothetical protein